MVIVLLARLTLTPAPAAMLLNWRAAPLFAEKTAEPVPRFDPVRVLSIVIVPDAGAETVRPFAVPASELNWREAPLFAEKRVPVPDPRFAPVRVLSIVIVP